MSAGPGDRVVTPEAVSLELDVAGVGSRAIALLIDSLIQGGIWLLGVVVFFAAGLESAASAVVFFVVVFFATWLYFPLFEGLWKGQTPGKRAQRLRVVQTDGQPARWPAILVRNLVRIVDSLLWVGVIPMLLTRRAQRLGDLAAGTIVVREPALSAPAPLVLEERVPPGEEGALPPRPGRSLDTGRLTEADYELVRTFLVRRPQLTPEARSSLARELAARTRARVPGEEGGDDEWFLEEVARAFRRRFAGGADDARR